MSRFEFAVQKVGETRAAIQVSLAGSIYWLPKSQVRLRGLDERSGNCRIDVPDWLAWDRGWECDEDAEVMRDGKTRRQWREVGEVPPEDDDGEYGDDNGRYDDYGMP